MKDFPFPFYQGEWPSSWQHCNAIETKQLWSCQYRKITHSSYVNASLLENNLDSYNAQTTYIEFYMQTQQDFYQLLLRLISRPEMKEKITPAKYISISLTLHWESSIDMSSIRWMSHADWGERVVKEGVAIATAMAVVLLFWWSSLALLQAYSHCFCFPMHQKPIFLMFSGFWGPWPITRRQVKVHTNNLSSSLGPHLEVILPNKEVEASSIVDMSI